MQQAPRRTVLRLLKVAVLPAPGAYRIMGLTSPAPPGYARGW